MNHQTEHLQFLKHLENIWNLKNQCKKLSKSNKFSDNDIRNTFFRQIMNIINDYYSGMIMPVFINRVDKSFSDGVLRPYFPVSEENDLISNLGFFREEPYLKTWHDMKKLGLVFNLWIVFEDSIDIIYTNIITKDELQVNQNTNYNKIKKIIENKLNTEDLNYIKKKLMSEYIGVNNKYNYVLNNLNLEKIQLKEYREFLQFFNILRNTLHTNSRPLKDYQFNLSIGNIMFKKNKHIDFFTFDILYYSIEMFLKTYCLIRDNLSLKREIFNPSTLVKGSY